MNGEKGKRGLTGRGKKENGANEERKVEEDGKNRRTE